MHLSHAPQWCVPFTGCMTLKGLKDTSASGTGTSGTAALYQHMIKALGEGQWKHPLIVECKKIRRNISRDFELNDLFYCVNAAVFLEKKKKKTQKLSRNHDCGVYVCFHCFTYISAHGISAEEFSGLFRSFSNTMSP